MTAINQCACRNFVEEKMGAKYTENRAVEFHKSYEESGIETPIFFILSPGVDPLKDVEALGKKMGFTGDNKNFHNISLGQGQEIVAEQALDLAAKEGHWVVLQVIIYSVQFCFIISPTRILQFCHCRIIHRIW